MRTKAPRREENGVYCFHGGKRYCKVFEMLDDAVIFFDHREGRFVDVNEAALRLYGYTRSEFLGLPFTAISAEPEASVAALRRSVQGKRSRIPLRFHKRKDGTVFPVEIVTSSGRLPPDVPQFAIIRDLSERLKAVESAQRLAAIVEATHDAVISIDPKGVIQTWNPGARRMFGYAASEAIGRHIALIIPPGLKRELAKVFRDAADHGVAELETKRRRKDGRLIDVSVTVSPIRCEKDTLTGYCGVLHDISRRKRDEEALRESETRFRLAFEHARDAVFWADAKTGVQVNCNKAAEKLLGTSRSDILGLPMTALFTKESARTAKRMFLRHVAGRALPTDELVVQARDGRKVPVLISPAVVRIAGRDIIQGVFRDITELRDKERELQEMRRAVIASQERERGRIGRELHDGVGQILSGIKFRLQSLAVEVPRSPASAVRTLRRVAGRFDRAIAEIRRASQNLMPPELEALGLKSALDSLGRTVSERSGMKVDIRCPGCRGVIDKPTTLALFRIAQEALANAEKHSRGAKAVVSLRRLDHRFELTVTDDGRGFDSRRSRGLPGQGGAGLANIRERAESLGGSMAVRSRPGRGTRVAVRIPLPG